VEESLTTKDKIIVALDLPSIDSARDMIKTLGKEVSWYKIGLQLFALGGPTFVQEVKAAGAKIFLDLKFHDIPNTVRSAVESACALGVDMLTIHLSGGSDLCQAAMKGRGAYSTLILGVTVLTSQTEATLSEIGVNRSMTQQVIALATLAKATGVTGLIASPLEVEPLRVRSLDHLQREPPAGRVPPGLREQRRRQPSPAVLRFGRDCVDTDD